MGVPLDSKEKHPPLRQLATTLFMKVYRKTPYGMVFLLKHMDEVYRVLQGLFSLSLCTGLMFVLILKIFLKRVNPCIDPHIVGFWPQALVSFNTHDLPVTHMAS